MCWCDRTYCILKNGTDEVKNCQYCDEPLQEYRQRKFCSPACHHAHRRQQASRSEKAKRNRRDYLLRRLQNGVITLSEFDAQSRTYLDDGLI
jgi:hypothetical protein